MTHENMASSIVLKSLSILLGIFFVFIGLIKMSSFLNKELHKDVRKEYVKYAKVFPLSVMLDFKIPAKWYRRIIGCIEVVCGFSMATIPLDSVKLVANVALVLNSLNAIYAHYMVEDKFEKVAPTLVFLFMLIGRLVIDYQGRKVLAEQKIVAENDNRTKQD